MENLPVEGRCSIVDRGHVANSRPPKLVPIVDEYLDGPWSRVT